MPKTLPEIIQIFKGEKKGKRADIPKAINHESRIKFHSDTILAGPDAGQSFTDFTKFVQQLLRPDKFRIFLTLFKFPARTVEVTGRIYTTLSKVFEGRNPVYKYEFSTPELLEDWLKYRSSLKAWEKWRNEGYNTMKTSINSFIVVDLPSEQKGAIPEPYFYFLSIKKVIDFDTDPSGEKIAWIAFKQPDGKTAFFDDTHYRVYQNSNDTYILESESPHDLGYCPVNFFWSSPINGEDNIVKKSPITDYLSALDMLLFYIISNEHLNLYARFPVFSVFEEDCNYVNHSEGAGEYCDGGFLKTEAGDYIIYGGAPKPCPVCGDSSYIGAGSIIGIDPPGMDNNNADLRNPVQMLSADVVTLEFNSSDIEKRKDEIYSYATGGGGHVLNASAVNESQVFAIFEGLNSSIDFLQRNFEKAITWTDETMCLLRYGADKFSGASISLGTDRYIMNSGQILAMYNTAKQANFSTSTLNLLEDKYYETEFRNNPQMLQRQTVLSNLDPFRHLSLDQVMDMYRSNEIAYDDYILKANFSSLVMRFERENTTITTFASGLNFDKKISKIRATLLAYAKEMAPAEKII